MSADLIYVAYNWVGPTGPIGNIRTPDIYDLTMAENYDCVEVFRHSRAARETFGLNCADYGNKTGTNFQVTAAAGLKPEDTFIYPITLGHKDQMRMLFDASAFGIFERSRIPRRTLELIRHCRGYLVLEHGFEAFVTDPELDCIHQYMKTHQIPMNKVIYATGTGNIYEVYANYCKRKNIPECDQMKFVRFYPTMESFAYNENQDPKEMDYDPDFLPEKRFLSLNLRPRQHRTLLLGMFHKQGLLDNSYFSYCGLRHGESIQQHLDMAHLNACDLDPEIYTELNTQMDRFYLDPDPVNTVDVVYDMGNHDTMAPYYHNSLVSISTETTFHTHIMAVTEKSFKAIKYKHPFILAGAQGLLQNVRDLGYKTFDDFWDEGYDDIFNPNKRLQRIVQICEEINSWSDDQVREFRHEVKPILEHNYELLVSNPYSEVYQDMYKYVMADRETYEILEDIQ